MSGSTAFIAPGASVLVVDDVEVNLAITEGLLQPRLMKVDLRESGAEAIEAVKANKYDLILMDHLMPDMDGIETVAHIRAMGQNMPVVALTANTGGDMRKIFLENGFDDFLPKPIDTSDLDKIIIKWLPGDKIELLACDGNDNNANAEAEAGLIEIIETEAEIEIAGVDAVRGIAMSGGKSENYLRLLGVFGRDLEKKIAALEESMRTGDLHLFTVHAHALKSAAANIGATGISEAAAELEDAGKQGGAEFVASRGGEFIADLKTLMRNIGAALAERRQAADINIDAGLLKAELANLKEGLDAFDSDTIENAANALHEFINAPNIGEAVAALLQKKLFGEYDEAIELIDELAAKI